MYAVLAEESLTRPGSLQTIPAHQLYVMRNNFFSLLSELYVCVHVKKKWCRKGSHSPSVSGLNWKENTLAVLWLSGSVLSRCFLAPLGMLFVMKTLKDEWLVVIMAYKLAVFCDIERIFCISIYYSSVLSLHIQSTNWYVKNYI